MDRMALHAQRLALDQRRPAAVARLLDRVLGLPVHSEHVGAVDDHAVESVRLRPVGEVLDGVLEVRRRRVRPLVVVADEDDGQLPHCEVHSLMRIAASHCAYANQPTATGRSSRIAKRQRAADSHRKHRREMADHRKEAKARVGHMDVSIPALARTVGAAHVLGEDPPGLDARG